MERLVVVATYDMNENTIRFKVAFDNKAALHMVTQAREQGLVSAVGAINYQYSKEKAYAQLRASLKKKILEKVKAKI